MYRVLLRVHPSARAGYRSQMAATFDALLHAAARRGLSSIAALLVSESIGLVRDTHSQVSRPRLMRLDVLAQDLRFVCRSLAATPVFSLLVIGTLALGMGANGALFIVIDRLFFRPPGGVHDVETLTRLYRRVPSRSLGASPADVTVTPYMSFPAFRDVEAALRAEARVIGYGELRVPIGRGESPEITPVAWVGPGYFATLEVAAPTLGRYLTDEECRVETPVATAVISYEAWQRRLGASRYFVECYVVAMPLTRLFESADGLERLALVE